MLHVELAGDWQSRLVDAYFTSPTVWAPITRDFPELGSDPAAGLVDPLQPVLLAARARLQQSLDALPGVDQVIDAPRFVASYIAPLPGQLLKMAGRSLVLELHLAGTDQRLAGATPQARYQSFLDQLRQRDAALDLLATYPVLAEQIQTRVDQWVACGRRFVEHLLDDGRRLRRVFPAEAVGRVVRVEPLGDRHRGGQCVLMAHFESGRKLVYKPKSLAVDFHFQHLICWLNRRGLEPALRPLAVLDGGDHGWVECVRPEDCRDTAELSRHFLRKGSLLALGYVLGCTDLHYENILPAGEHPVLIDLEAMFRPELAASTSGAEQAAWRHLDHSVLGTGLLPQPMWGRPDQPGIDLSGLGTSDGQAIPFTVPAWEAAGTDQMRFVRKPAWFQHAGPKTTLQGAPVDAARHGQLIDEGFTRTCRLLLRWRDELLAADGPLRRFEGASTRVLLRSTRVYGELMHESFHPELMADARQRDELFLRLERICAVRPEMRRLVSQEMRDLQAGDIPLLTTRAGSRDLRTSDERQVPEFFATDGLSAALRRLERLDECEIERQRWLVRAALGGASDRGQPINPRDSQSPHDRLLHAAGCLAGQLSDQAIRCGGQATWLGVTPPGDPRGRVAPLGFDLYDGLPGVILFLACWGEVARDRAAARLARQGLRTWQQQLSSAGSPSNSPGAFTGWGGAIQLLTHLGTLWNRDDLWLEARRLVGPLRAAVADDQQFDLIGGCAGGLLALLNLHAVCPGEELLDAALDCGRRLAVGQIAAGHGVGWPAPATGSAPLTGFSHGVAGIAMALLRMARVSGQSRFRKLALDALRYERSMFCPGQGNWRDLRLATDAGAAESTGNTGEGASRVAPACGLAWCHGAPGIGLARIASLQYHDDEQARAEVRVAVRTTAASGFGSNHSLCHGDLGNLELLRQAAVRGLDAGAQPLLESHVVQVLDELAHRGPRCGTHNGLETPGLMTGLAGIGYGLLRLAAPDQVPSILTLEPFVTPAVRGTSDS
ncbi:MAG: type 2 lantipeptide synthetase LanM family protein [Pirellulaceae bacterium]|nr:type 2 lantipeptide synthetase LanM family protein [Pirellulaceae bacterium]